MIKRPTLIGLLALTICFAVIALYFTTHKPFSPELAMSLILILWRLLVAGVVVMLAGGLGFRLLPGLDQPPLVRLALQAGLGLGLFSLAILVVGSTLGIPIWAWWVLPLLLAILLHRTLYPWLRQVGELRNIWSKSGRLGRGLGVMSALLFLLALSSALAPPLHFDSLVYHLTMPHAYLEAGKVSYLPWIVMTGMPQNTEMLHTWAIALGGDQAATTLGWLVGLLACLGLLGYLRQHWDIRAAWVGVAAVMAGYTPVKLLSSGYVEWPIFLAGLGVLALLENWRRTGKNSDILLAGVFTGLAVGNKYPSGVLALAGLAVLAWHAWQRKARFIPAALRYGLAATFVVLPWLAKNWLTTGNPIYPFFFAGGEMTAVRLSVYQSLPAWGDWMEIVLLPFRATFLGIEGGDGYSVALGPLLLGFGLLSWLSRKSQNEDQRISLQNAAVLSGGGLIIWAMANQLSGFLIQTRFYISIFPAFAILAAAGEYGLRQVQLRKVRLERISAALVLLVLGLNLLEVTHVVLKQGSPQSALGITSETDYLANNLGWFQPAMQAVRDLPPGSRALLLYEPRSLYCAPRCAPDEIMDRWKRTRALESVDAVIRAWQAEGFTHVLLYRTGVEFLVEAGDPHHPPEDLASLNQFLAQLPAPIKFSGVYELYSLNY